MPMTHEEVKQIIDARRQARAAGMFVVEKPGKFLLYRELKPKNVLVGTRANLADFKRLVAKAASAGAQA